MHQAICIVCGASHKGLWAVVKQLRPEGWRPISFAFRFLNAAELKSATKELETLAVGWGQNTSKSTSSDHKALVTLLNEYNHKNQTMVSRLTR